MNGPYYNNHSVPPDNIIDLRQKTERLKIAWYDLTAVRFVRYIIRILFSLVIGFFKLLYDFFAARGRSEIIKTVEEVKEEFEEETKIIATPSKRKHSLGFKLVNFFALLCLIASPLLAYSAWRSLAPLRSAIIEKTNSAFNGLFNAKNLLEQKDFVGAEKSFETAGDNFVSAQENLKTINQGLLELASVLPNDTFKLAAESRHLLNAGKLSARIGADLAAAITPNSNSNLLNILEKFSAYTIPASEDAEKLASELDKVNVENLPSEYRDRFIKLKEQATILAPGLKESVELVKRSLVFLGKNNDKRYLLVFQNNSEKRASGGFIGSFALVDIKKGAITNINVPKGGSYDTEAGLYRRVVAPQPLWLVNPLWHFWDANWWPDWPTTARKLEWFYEKSDGPTVDGVISLTPTVIERLLKIHGPVDMTQQYGVIITADNFWEVTQTFSEQKPNVTKEPKKIIGDLMTKLMEDIPKDMDQQKLFALISVFEGCLNEKHILLYFNDPILETSVKYFGWDGSIKQNDRDYLMVVDTNIGGQKSDRMITETINHDAQILPDTSIVVTLKIQRAHTAPKNQQFVGFRNVNWMRIYVPLGSRLISASGFRQPEQSYFSSPESSWEQDPDLAAERAATTEPASGTKIYTENNKTVFANWSMVDPGETADIELRYELPFRYSEPIATTWIEKIKKYFATDSAYRYNLLVQKQPGSQNTILHANLSVSGGWEPIWNYPKDVEVDTKGFSVEKTLDTDFFLNILFHKY